MKKMALILVTMVLSLFLIGCSNRPYAQMWTEFVEEENHYQVGFTALDSGSNIIASDDLTLGIVIEDYFGNQLYEQTYDLRLYDQEDDLFYRFTILKSDVISQSNIGHVTYNVYRNDELLDDYKRKVTSLYIEDKFAVLYDYASDNWIPHIADNAVGYEVSFAGIRANIEVIILDDGNISISSTGLMDGITYSFHTNFIYTGTYPINLYVSLSYNDDGDLLSPWGFDESVTYDEFEGFASVNLDNIPHSLGEKKEVMDAFCDDILEYAMELFMSEIRLDTGITF